MRGLVLPFFDTRASFENRLVEIQGMSPEDRKRAREKEYERIADYQRELSDRVTRLEEGRSDFERFRDDVKQEFSHISEDLKKVGEAISRNTGFNAGALAAAGTLLTLLGVVVGFYLE